MIVFLNGSYMPKAEALISPDDRGFLFGDGVYEVIRHYGGNFLKMTEHLTRMRNGLQEIGLDVFDHYDLADVSRELIERNKFVDQGMVYLQITRGAPEVRTHAFPPTDTPPTVYGMAFPYVKKVDPDVGVSMITTPDVRWGRCDIKTIGLLANCMTQQRARENGAFDAILIREGVALESSSSSFFAVIDGQVRTAPKSNHILPSITRQLVLDLCADADIPHRETNVHEEQLATADELFLAGTTLEMLPIISVDGNQVGSGVPGPITNRLRELFAAEVAVLKL